MLAGGDRSHLVLLPWTRFFDGAIYGEADRPMDCYPNSGPEELKRYSHPVFASSIVAAGEIQDRYLAGEYETFEATMSSLSWLFAAAEVLRISGFDAYAYRGPHRQSIEMATQYYACYVKSAGSWQPVTRNNAGACPNHEQYEGKTVHAIDGNMLIGAYRFPDNTAIKTVEAIAKDRATGLIGVSAANDIILFGKWAD